MVITTEYGLRFFFFIIYLSIYSTHPRSTETNGNFFFFFIYFIGRYQPIDDNRSISTIVDDLLEELGHTESRAAKMDIDDLLKYVSGI